MTRRDSLMSRLPITLWGVFALAMMGSSTAWAAKGVPLADAPPTGAEGSKYFHEHAQQYEIVTADDTSPLKLIEAPLLNWTNPARTNEQGILVVWLKDGRPAALATLFTYQVGQRVYEKHELLSLSSQPLTASLRGVNVWTPRASGSQPMELDDVPPPAEQSRPRSLQMRRIARDFSGTMIQSNGQKTELRLLPQPLYRYQGTSGTLLDGAVFSLNVGTDPEVLILVEAHRDTGKAKWTYALARLHFNELRVMRNDQPLWNAAPAYELMGDLTGQTKYMTEPYFIYYPESLTAARVEPPSR
jgi:hypothetical protein